MTVLRCHVRSNTVAMFRAEPRRSNAVAQLVEALYYKPEGRGFDSRWFN
jgi:hypothetical protein